MLRGPSVLREDVCAPRPGRSREGRQVTRGRQGPGPDAGPPPVAPSRARRPIRTGGGGLAQTEERWGRLPRPRPGTAALCVPLQDSPPQRRSSPRLAGCGGCPWRRRAATRCGLQLGRLRLLAQRSQSLRMLTRGGWDFPWPPSVPVLDDPISGLKRRGLGGAYRCSRS